MWYGTEWWITIGAIPYNMVWFGSVWNAMQWYYRVRSIWPENFHLPTFLHQLSARFACWTHLALFCWIRLARIPVLDNHPMFPQFEIFAPGEGERQWFSWIICTLYFSWDQNGLIATTVIHVRDDITEWGQVRMPFVVQPALQCIKSNCTRRNAYKCTRLCNVQNQTVRGAMLCNI